MERHDDQKEDTQAIVVNVNMTQDTQLVISSFLLISLCAFFSIDIVWLVAYNAIWTQPWIVSIFILHTMACMIGAIGFIYNNESKKVMPVVLNLILFIFHSILLVTRAAIALIHGV